MQHLIHSALVEIPFFTVSPVLVGDFPLFTGRILTFRKTGQLRILIDLYPEFNDYSAPVSQFLFELVDLIVSALPVIFRTEAFQTLYHDTPVPAAVKNSDMAGLWQPGPETPQKMAGFFKRLRTGNGVHLIASGIQSSSQTLDISALAGSIPAFVDDHHRDFLFVQPIVQSA